MFVTTQYLFLKSSLFKNLMRAYSPCISEISLSAKRMRAVDQKHNYQLEWPYTQNYVGILGAGLVRLSLIF